MGSQFPNIPGTADTSSPPHNEVMGKIKNADGSLQPIYAVDEGGSNFHFATKNDKDQELQSFGRNNLNIPGLIGIWGRPGTPSQGKVYTVAGWKTWPYLNADGEPIDQQGNPLMAAAPTLTTRAQTASTFFSNGQNPFAQAQAAPSGVSPFALSPTSSGGSGGAITTQVGELGREFAELYISLMAPPSFDLNKVGSGVADLDNLQALCDFRNAEMTFLVNQGIARFVGEVVREVSSSSLKLDVKLLAKEARNYVGMLYKPPVEPVLKDAKFPSSVSVPATGDYFGLVASYFNDTTAWAQKVQQIGTAADFVGKYAKPA